MAIEADIEVTFEDVIVPTFIGFVTAVEIDVEVQLLDIFPMTNWRTFAEGSVTAVENASFFSLTPAHPHWNAVKWNLSAWK